jgi:hypothetical protein
VLASLRSQSSQSSSLWIAVPGEVSFVRLDARGVVWPSLRASLRPWRRIWGSICLVSFVSFGLLIEGWWVKVYQLD